MSTITITDVADEAGVSKATVSAVLNDRPNVGPATRDRVRKVIADLNYRPRASARLRGERRSSPVIGLVIKEIANPYFAEIVKGVRAEAAERGYLLVVCDTEGSAAEEARSCRVLRDHGAEGIIVSPVRGDGADYAHLFDLRRQRFPFVLLGSVVGIQASAVSVDSTEAAKTAAQHLLDAGLERVVHVAGPAYSQHSRERIEGVRAAYSESSRTFEPGYIVEAGASIEEGYDAGRRLFAGYDGPRPLGVTCYNDLVALGVWRAALEAGWSVPEDVALVGLDDIELVQQLPLGLSSVHSPNVELGRRSAALLFEHLTDGAPAQPTHVVLDTHLVVRASSQVV
ncbi:LacI family DNA-binding transcriptional regulator [Rubrivirga sp.]|uniref:LacI family DNA-binding transcriptional regulator n=1 Tax=Rubrivirga sp. TaxID=1885344 RepID=UPI003B52DAED